MHSIREMSETAWEVVLIRSDEPRMPLFAMLSFTQAIKLCNILNGGNAEFEDWEWEYIERCAVE